MKAFTVAIGLRTLVSLGLLIYEPGFVSPLLTCIRLIGRSCDWEAAQAAVNDAAWWWHTLPLMLALGIGYLAIAGLGLWRLTKYRRLIGVAVGDAS